MELPSVDSCLERWDEISTEFKSLEGLNKVYVEKLEELCELQSKCVKEITHQKYQMGVIKRSLRKLNLCEEEKERVEKLYRGFEQRNANIIEIEHALPKPSGMYLKIILGNVNVSILNKNEKFKYKDEYEKFKLILSVIGFLLSVINLFTNIRKNLAENLCLQSSSNLCTYFLRNPTDDSLRKRARSIATTDNRDYAVMMQRRSENPDSHHYLSSFQLCPPYTIITTVILIRLLELSLMFLLVWYYCTLTIRESILKVNGSKIKGWWRLHHFISTAASAILLIWPISPSWYLFRPQFMVFNVYISIVQYLQFRYQQGVLYRLKALGERHNMDITIEGFHSWMWRGLGFLLPFLFAGYIFQLYNAYSLFNLAYTDQNAPWQVSVLSVLFFFLFLGNTVTTVSVIPQKIHEYRRRKEGASGTSDNNKADYAKDD